MRIVKYEREGARIWQRTVEILVCRTREVPKARGPTRIFILHSLAAWRGGASEHDLHLWLMEAAYGMAYRLSQQDLLS